MGNIGGRGELIFTVDVPVTRDYKERLYYLSGNQRSLWCSVNGETGYDLEIAFDAGSNTIRLYSPDYGPDVNKIGILLEE